MFPAVVTDFGKSGGNDDYGTHTPSGAIVDNPIHRTRRNRDDDELRNFGQFLDARICFQRAENLTARVDRIDRAAKTCAKNGVEDSRPDVLWVLRCADYRNRARLKKRTKRRGGRHPIAKFGAGDAALTGRNGEIDFHTAIISPRAAFEAGLAENIEHLPIVGKCRRPKTPKAIARGQNRQALQ